MSQTRESSLRGRLILTVVSIVAPLIAGFCFLYFLAAGSVIAWRFDQEVANRARTLAHLVEVQDGNVVVETNPELPLDLGQTVYWQVWAPDGTEVFKSDNLGSAGLRPLAGTHSAPEVAGVELPGGQQGRAVGFQFRPRGGTGAVTMVVAQDRRTVTGARRGIGSWLWILGTLSVASTAIAVAVGIGRGLRSVDRLAGRIESLDGKDLSARLEPGGLPRELQPPVEKLNALLAQLEESVGRERRFTADVSHELRTPVAALLTLLEVTASRDRNATAYREAIAEAKNLVADMSGMIENLLLLARLDASQVELQNEAIVLADLIEATWRPFAAQAEQRNLDFRNLVPAASRFHSDRHALRLVATNLLANAAAYTEEGGRVEVRSEPTQGVIVEVWDSGPSISIDDQARLFDRFWRADEARSHTRHCGIGLPLARAWCEALGYELEVESNPTSGTRFVVRTRRTAGA